MTDDLLVDDCYAFFVCCWHLKDWLKADPAVAEQTRDQMERFVNGNPWLCLCADVANGSKHLKLDHARLDSPARLEKTSMLDLGVGIPLFPIKGTLVISLSGGTHDVRRVVECCVRQWDGFLAERDLV